MIGWAKTSEINQVNRPRSQIEINKDDNRDHRYKEESIKSIEFREKVTKREISNGNREQESEKRRDKQVKAVERR